MSQNIRICNVTDHESLCEISKSRLDSEQKLENWLEADIPLINLLMGGERNITLYHVKSGLHYNVHMRLKASWSIL